MGEEFQDQLGFERGYFPNQGLIGPGRVPNSLIDGKNMWVEGPGRLRSWGGATTLAVTYGGSIMGLLNDKLYTLGSTGSATVYRGGAYFYIGNGNFQVGTDTTSLSYGAASLSPRAVFATSTTTSVLVGLNTSITVTASDGAAVTTGLPVSVGTYSFKVTISRDSSNAESNPSPTSAVYTAPGGKSVNLLILGSIMGGAQDGPFSYNIYVSNRGFPDGPWRFLKRIPSTQSTPTIQWTDGDLSFTREAPLTGENDAPPAGTHIFALGNVMVVAGVGGTGGIHPSKPGKPENYPADFLTFLNPAEPVLGIRGRPADGWQYVFCRNSLHAVFLQSDDGLSLPVGVRAIWSEVGIASANGASFVGGEFYCFSGRKGALRTTAGQYTAEPDGQFALPVETVTDTWTPANVVAGYSLETDSVAYFHGNVCLMYMRKQECWSLPFYLADSGITGNVTSCVTYQGRLIFSVGSSMYEMAGSSATIPYNAVPAWRDAGAPGLYKTITGVRTAFDLGTTASTTIQNKSELLINFDSGQVKHRITTNASGKTQYTAWSDGKCNVKNAVSYTIRQVGVGANQYVYDAVVEGNVTKARV